jgi:hypothetical protein
MLHQHWEDGTLAVEQHAQVDPVHHSTWTRWSRRGGLMADVEQLPPKSSGKNLQREARKMTEAAAAVSSEPPIHEMMKDRPRWWRRLNELLRGAANRYKELYEEGELDSCMAIARMVKLVWDFDLRTIRKAGEAVMKNPGFEPDVRGGKPTLLNNPLSHAFFDYVEKQIRRLDAQGQRSIVSENIEDFVKTCWVEFYAKNNGARAPEFKKATMDKVKAKIETFAQRGMAQRKAERTAESLDDPRNVISWAAVAIAALAGRPAELKCNWDDTSFMIGEDMGVKAIAYTHKEVAEAMKKLGRNMSFHSDENAEGKLQCRMFVAGFLTTSAGSVPLCVIKFYDRQLPHQRQRIEKHYLGRLYNGCHLWWLFIKLPPQGEASNDDEEVNRSVIGELVAPTLQAEKLAYVVESKRILQAQQRRQANFIGNSALTPAALSSNSRASMGSVASRSSSRSHSGLRTNQMPPGNFTASELFVRQGDDPRINGGVLFGQRQAEEQQDSSDDNGSASEADSVPEDDVAGLFDATLAEQDSFAAQMPPTAMPPLLDAPSLPAHQWVPQTLEARFPCSFDIHTQLQHEAANGFQFRNSCVVDGCCPQIQSLMGKEGSANPNGVLHDIIAPDGNDVVKGPSSCSMFSNANDATRCHCFLKDYVKTKMRKKPVFTSRLMRDFLDHVLPSKGLDPAAVRTIRHFASHIEDMICKVWTPPNVKSGWVKTGLLADTPSGIDVDQILSHWVGMKDLLQPDYEAVKAALPLLGQEAILSSSGSPSDASMAPLEKYFPRRFDVYKTDRSLMSWSRKRAAILVASKRDHQESFGLNFIDRPEVAEYDDRVADPPQSHELAVVEGVEFKVCWCRAAATPNARLYKNTAAAWKTHKNTVAHQRWKQHLLGQREPHASSDALQPSVFPSFSESLFAQKTECSRISAIATELNLRLPFAQRLDRLGVTDDDLPCFALMRPQLLEELLHLPHALAVNFALKCGDVFIEPVRESNELDEHDLTSAAAVI